MLQCYLRADPNYLGKPSEDRRRGRSCDIWAGSDPRNPVR